MTFRKLVDRATREESWDFLEEKVPVRVLEALVDAEDLIGDAVHVLCMARRGDEGWQEAARVVIERWEKIE